MTLTAAPLTADQVRWLVDQAARAPSIHNTQPWLFTWTGRELELYADTARGLSVSDPDGRELVISCGAALFNLRLALRKLEARAAVTVLPNPSDPRLLARVEIVAGVPATTSERRAYAAMLRRHTHRGHFEDRPLPAGLAVSLQHAAEDEGAELVYVPHPGQRRRVLHLARAAERHCRRDERVRAEIEAWTRAAGSTARDGVPAFAFAADVPTPADDLPARDFDLGRGLGRLPVAFSAPGVVAALVTPGDLEGDWLAAGQALEHVLVTATDAGVGAALHSQITELPDLRAELRRELSTDGSPQILLRFGFAPSGLMTPRRPSAEVMDNLSGRSPLPSRSVGNGG